MLNSSFEIHSVALCHRNTSFMKSHALQPSAMAKGVRNGANDVSPMLVFQSIISPFYR